MSRNTLLHWWLNPGYWRVDGEAWFPSSTSLGSLIDLRGLLEFLRQHWRGKTVWRQLNRKNSNLGVHRYIGHSSCYSRPPWPFLREVVESSKYKHASNWNLGSLVTPELGKGLGQHQSIRLSWFRAPISSLLFSTIKTGSLVGHVELVEITGGERTERSRIQRYSAISRQALHEAEWPQKRLQRPCIM